MQPKVVSVFGASQVQSQEEYDFAQTVGFKLAQKAYHVKTGGYSSTMEAVSKGASQYNDQNPDKKVKIFGVLVPTLFVSRPTGNAFLTDSINCDNIYDRIKILCQSDAFVVLDGSLGTLNELIMIWNEITINQMNHQPLKSILVMKNPWEQILTDLGKHKSMNKVPTYFNLLTFVQSADEIVQKL